MSKRPKWLLRLITALKRLRCGITGHGNPVGACDVQHYDAKLRIFRYRAYATCDRCGGDMGDY